MSKKSAPKTPSAPPHLVPSTREWWDKVCADYEFNAADLSVLEVACVQWDRAVAARETIAKCKTGALVEDRFGQLREHPSCAIEQCATRLFLASIRQLGLGLEPTDEGRLPDPIAPMLRRGD